MEQFDVLEQEERIIRYIFDNPLIQNRIRSHIDPLFFDDPDVQGLVTHLKKYLDTYPDKSFPNPRTLAELMRKGDIKTKFKEIMLTPVGEETSEAVHNAVEDFFRQRMTLKVIRGQLDAIANDDLNRVASTMVDSMQEAVNFHLNIDIGLEIEEDCEEAIRRMLIQSDSIPSSIHRLNELTDINHKGGWYKKAVSVLMGQANVGKTMVMCNEAAYAYRCGYNVLYVTLELTEDQIMRRIMSNLTNISYSEIINRQSELRTRIHRSNGEITGHNDSRGYLVTKYIPAGSKPSDLDNLIQEVENVRGDKVDLLVLDYLGEMSANRGGAADNTYVSGKKLIQEIRNIAVKREIAILTGSQINRDGYDGTAVGMKNTSDSAGINHVADLMVTITQDETLKDNEMFMHKIIKNRMGRKDDIFLSKVTWDKMRLADVTEGEMHAFNQSNMSRETPSSTFSRPASTTVTMPA